MTKARDDQTATAEDLSESARAVVRDAGDPRIDAHLRALGLAPEPADATTTTSAAEPADAPDLAVLRSRVLDLEASLAASQRRARSLTAALGGALVIAVILAVLLVSRLG